MFIRSAPGIKQKSYTNYASKAYHGDGGGAQF